MTDLARSQRHRAAAVAVLAILAVLVAQLARNPFVTVTDAGVWMPDGPIAAMCLGGDAGPCTRLSKFPLWYLANSLFLHAAIAHDFAPTRAIAALNFVCLMIPAIATVLVRKDSNRHAAALAYALLIALSPVPSYYIYSGALEVQTGVAIGMTVWGACLLFEGHGSRARALLAVVALCGTIAVLGKDTNVVIVFPSIIAAAYHPIRSALSRGPPLRREATIAALAALVVAAAVGMLLSVQYNLFRYDSFTPQEYLNEARATAPPPSMSLVFLAASFLSPNGGVLAFWGFPVVVTLSVMRRLAIEPLRIAVPASVLGVVGSSVGYAMWWAPFGWDSWGDRLMVAPCLGAAIALTCTAGVARDQDRSAHGRTRHGALAFVVLGCLGAFSFAYFAASTFQVDRALAYRRALFGPACTTMLHERSKTRELSFWRTESYYACARERFVQIPLVQAVMPANSSPDAP